MAFTVKTLANLKQSLADKLTAGVLPTASATLAYWVRLLNRGKDYCADRLQLTKSTSLTTSSGAIALPDDFVTINEVFDSGDTKWALISKEDSEGATGNVYWITGNQDSRFSLNAPTDEVLTVYYTYRPEDMSADADECVIPDPEAVVCYAYSKLRMAQTDPLEDADKEMGECERRLDEIIYQRNINNGGTTFSLSEGKGVTDNWPVV